MAITQGALLKEQGGWTVSAVPVFQDNFVYVVSLGKNAVVIDAGEAEPVAEYVRENGLILRDVLVTHQHADHTRGYNKLRALIAEGSGEPGPVERLALPGHTSEDCGYYFPDAGVICTGDCLINGACGRVLGGRLEDLYQSLQRIKELPPETLILGGHDYLLDNMHFGLSVAPLSQAMKERIALYERNPQQAIFMTLGDEVCSNVFLQAESYESFCKLRNAKDVF